MRTKPKLVLVLAALVASAALATDAAAQPPAPPAGATPWDASVMVGAFAGRPSQPTTDGYYDNWFNTGQIGVVVGRHFSAHLKGEVEVSTTGEGRQYVQRYATIPGSAYPVPYAAEQFTTVREVAGSVVWQFFENQWVHPFLQVGAVADVDRFRTHTWRQSFFSGTDPRQRTEMVLAEERDEGPSSTTHVRLLVGAGVKLYVSPRVFFRADGRVIVGAHTQHLALRGGFGVDF